MSRRGCCCNQTCPPWYDKIDYYARDGYNNNSFLKISPTWQVPSGKGYCGGKPFSYISWDNSANSWKMQCNNHGLAEGDIISINCYGPSPTKYNEGFVTTQIPNSTSGGSPIIDSNNLYIGYLYGPLSFKGGAGVGASWWTKVRWAGADDGLGGGFINGMLYIVADYYGEETDWWVFKRAFHKKSTSFVLPPVYSAERYLDQYLYGNSSGGYFSYRRHFAVEIRLSKTTTYCDTDVFGERGLKHNLVDMYIYDGTYAMRRRATLGALTGDYIKQRYRFEKSTDHPFIDCGCSGNFRSFYMATSPRRYTSLPLPDMKTTVAGYTPGNFNHTIANLKQQISQYPLTVSAWDGFYYPYQNWQSGDSPENGPEFFGGGATGCQLITRDYIKQSIELDLSLVTASGSLEKAVPPQPNTIVVKHVGIPGRENTQAGINYDEPLNVTINPGKTENSQGVFIRGTGEDVPESAYTFATTIGTIKIEES